MESKRRWCYEFGSYGMRSHVLCHGTARRCTLLSAVHVDYLQCYEKVETLLHECSCILWSRSSPRYGASKDRTVSAPYRADRHPLVSVNSYSSDLLAFHNPDLCSTQEQEGNRLRTMNTTSTREIIAKAEEVGRSVTYGREDLRRPRPF